MRKALALAGALIVAMAAPAARAAVVYSADGFNFDLGPDSSDQFVNSTPSYLAYCPDCTASPNILTITRTDSQSFDLLSMRIAGFSLTGWTVTAEAPLGTVLGTVTVSATGGNPSAAPSQPVGTGFVSTLYLVEHGGETDCVCISDLDFRVGSAAGPTTTVLSNGPASVAEPGSFAVLVAGLVAAGLVVRRRSGLA